MSLTFRYSNPAVIHWGEGSLAQLEGELARAGARRPFLLTTASVAKNPQLLGAVERAAGGLLCGRFSDIGQHAPVEAVSQAAKAVREAHADALVSAGGGSPIDAAKAVAWSLASGIELNEPGALQRSRGVKLAGLTVLRHFALPTTLSVAELSASAGFSAEGSHEKVGVAAPELLPAAVIYDAQLAVQTPVELWLSTGIRAVDHAVETLLGPGEHPLPDVAALEGLARLSRGLRAAKADPQSAPARTECQLGAWLTYLLPIVAANGLSHTLGKRLGSRHGIPHGVTSCLLLPHVMRHLAGRKPGALARIAQALGAADDAPGAVQRLIADLGLPQHLAAYRLSDAELREAARPLASEENSAEALFAILKAAS